MKRNNNIIINRDAHDYIADGALTNSKRPASLIEGVYPTHIDRGYGSTLFDVDGNRFTDFICGLGTNLFGYANPHISQAVARVMMSGGPVFSLGSREEVEFARRIKEMFPHLDKVRFLKTGSEGCAAAVRIARAFTGRRLVLTEGYHGWHDEFVSVEKPATGIPAHGNIMKLEPEYIRNTFSTAAAVIVEPVITDWSDDRRKWLEALREWCDQTGALLIFDETITAYRFHGHSVTRFFNIIPDLWIGGKAVGGGLPLSVIGGRKDVMEADYFVSSTWAGDRMALAAGCQAIDLLHGDFSTDTLWHLGDEFIEKFNAICTQVQIVGYPTRGVFEYIGPQFKHLFMQEMCKAGVLIGPSWFYNKFLHDEMQNVLSITKSVVKKILSGKVTMQGRSPVSPFAEKQRR